MVEQLSAELAAALMRELQYAYDLQNTRRFGRKLVRPVLVLTETRRLGGQWVSVTRRLEISLPLVLERTWPEVIGVLEHEMAHQFVDEVLKIHDEAPHGDTFRRVCTERAIDPRAAGEPVPSTIEATEGAKALERIRKLLALAGSSNQNEAELAMRKAHELMLRHNVDEIPREREFEIRHLGEPRRRINGVESDIVGLISEFFFVEVITIPVYIPREGSYGRVYEIAGTRANLEMAQHVYEFLLGTAERLWRENRGDARVRSGRDRMSYQSGVIRGFREKLLLERVQLRGVGLVWAGDKRLEDFYHRRNPRIVRRRRQIRISSAHAAGREAGRTVVLNKPVTTGPSSGGPRLLRG